MEQHALLPFAQAKPPGSIHIHAFEGGLGAKGQQAAPALPQAQEIPPRHIDDGIAGGNDDIGRCDNALLSLGHVGFQRSDPGMFKDAQAQLHRRAGQMLKILDAICPAVLIGQILGRWGNFFNGEAFGSSANIESLPWRMVVNGVATHPTFLYESIWNFIGFIIANILYRNKKFNGQIFTFYISWYGFGRAFIEMLRTDSLYVGNVKLMVVLGFGCFIVGTILYFYLLKKENASKSEMLEYEEYKNALANNSNSEE